MVLHEYTPEEEHPHPGGARIDLHAVADDTIVVTLSGEHDLSTQARLLEALSDAREEPKVIVDLTPCEFLDSTIIRVLVRARQGRTQQVAIVAPGGGYVQRILQLAGGDELLPVHGSFEDALRGLEESDAEGEPDSG
jgi:anti-anti-sigma factor